PSSLSLSDDDAHYHIPYPQHHNKPSTRAELAAYNKRLQGLRGLPGPLKTVLENIPKSAHPMDVMRTAVSALGTLEAEAEDHNKAGAQQIADRLMASMGSMLLYWHHYSQHGKRIETVTDDDSIG